MALAAGGICSTPSTSPAPSPSAPPSSALAALQLAAGLLAQLLLLQTNKGSSAFEILSCDCFFIQIILVTVKPG
jgi:mannitol-1-phosphate/altronate dehydrogenase